VGASDVGFDLGACGVDTYGASELVGRNPNKALHSAQESRR